MSNTAWRDMSYAQQQYQLHRLEAHANQFAASLNNDAAELAFRAFHRVLIETLASAMEALTASLGPVPVNQDDGA